MSTQMNDLLIMLSQDPFLTERFKEDPSGVLKNFDLTPGEAALLAVADSTAIDLVLKPKPSPNGKKKTKPKPKPKKKAAKKK